MSRPLRDCLPISLSVCALIALHVDNAAAAYRCIDSKGRVTYQDASCDPVASQRSVDTSDAFSTKPTPAIGPSPGRPTVQSGNSNSVDPAYANARGSWRGPTQFQLTRGGVRDESAQAVTAMVIELKPDGEVVGIIPGSGCKLSGLTTKFVADNMASVDVTLKECRDTRFNSRFTGYLNSSPAAREAKLSLQSFTIQTLGRPMEVRNVEAVLKR